MRGELFNVIHPKHMRIVWAIVYISIFVLFIFGVYQVAARIRTHTLPVGQVTFSIPYSKYVVGEEITFTITNGYNSSIYVMNKCPTEPLAVYYQQNGTWVRQHDKASEEDCSDEQRQVSVPANGRVQGSFAAWHNLFSRPGKYRVVAFVESYNALPYQEIEIINKPTVVAPSQTTTSSQSTVTQTNPTTTPTPTRQSKTITSIGGNISVEYDTSNIYVTSINPAAGCRYEGGKSGAQVEITFICGEQQTLIQLRIVNDQLIANISNSGGEGAGDD